MGMYTRVHGIFFPCLRAGLILTALLLVTGIPAAAQEVGGAEPAVAAAVEPHWSPYMAPASADPTQQVYIIVRGDNLWNLAARFYSDPLLWPQIWDANRYITDAHWIYPGDPLVIPASPEVAAQRMVGGEDEFGTEPMPGDAVAGLGGEPVPPEEMVDPDGAGDLTGFEYSAETPGALINPVDVYCAPMIIPDLEPYKYSISGAEEMEKVAQGTGDVLYLDSGSEDGISAGDQFFVHHKDRKVRHPESRQVLGWAMRQTAELEVLCTTEHTATAMLTHNCAAVYVGDLLIPREELPIPVVDPTAPLGRCEEPNGGKEGYLVYALDNQQALAEENIAVIDKGSDDGVSLGDFFSVFRFQMGERLMLGEAVVLRTERDTATVKIIASFREMYVGDRVDVK
jgi:hypothetical protein